MPKNLFASERKNKNYAWKFLSEKVKNKMVQSYIAGNSYREIATKFNLREDLAYRIMVAHSGRKYAEYRKLHSRNLLAGQAPFDKQQKIYIKEYTSGILIGDIAKKHKTYPAAVLKVLREGNPKKFEKLKKIHEKNFKAQKLFLFMKIVKKLNFIPLRDDWKKYAKGLTGYYIEFGRIARKKGYKSASKKKRPA